MEVTASKRMGLMLVAALILWSSISADASSLGCKLACAVSCSGDPVPLLCVAECLGHCEGRSFPSAASEYCDVGCFLSTCLDYHPGTKKVEVDVKKVKPCADSCSQDCQKTYSMH